MFFKSSIRVDKKHYYWLTQQLEQQSNEINSLKKENKALKKQLSLLCPIGDLPVIESLLAEKQMYMEEIQHLKQILKQLEENKDNHVLKNKQKTQISQSNCQSTYTKQSNDMVALNLLQNDLNDFYSSSSSDTTSSNTWD